MIPAMSITRNLLLFTALLLVTAACGRKRPASAPPPAAEVDAARLRRDSISADSARRAADARARADREAADRAAAERARIAAAQHTLEAAIYFGYDEDALTTDARRTLDAKVQLLSGSPAVRLRITGHTDERGSDEYNLALGQRRAAAAMRYLTARGIASNRLEIVSVGEEQPACSESAESCWSRNRRDEFTVTAGALAARAP
jgi:peptidoglycan-associated lipoprotein